MAAFVSNVGAVINSQRFTSARTRTTTANGTCSFAAGLVMVVCGDDGAIACAKTFLRARSRFHPLNFPITRRRIRYQRFEEMMCDVRDVIYRAIECVFICARRLGESAQLANELKRRRANLITRRGRTEIMQSLDVSAHDRPSSIVDRGSTISRCRRSLPQ
jgi:hypothetical protein